MPGISVVRNAIIDVVTSQIASMNGYRNFVDIAQVPALIVGQPTSDFTKSMNRGIDEWVFKLYLLVGIPEISFAQDELDQYVSGSGPNSIRRIIFENPTLNDVVEDSMITKMDEYGGTFESPKKPLIPHVGACLHLTAYFSGD